jgi:hypothetical protein
VSVPDPTLKRGANQRSAYGAKAAELETHPAIGYVNLSICSARMTVTALAVAG